MNLLQDNVRKLYFVFADQFENSSDRLKRVNFAIVIPKCQTNKRFT